MRNYILDENNKPVLVEDHTTVEGILRWAQWMGEADHHVADTQIGNARVSTVFIGHDMSLHLDEYFPEMKKEPPLLWETMVFGGPYDLGQNRYASYEEAKKGHAKIVQMLTS